MEPLGAHAGGHRRARRSRTIVRRVVGALVAVAVLATGLIAATFSTAYACSCFGNTNLGTINADDLVLTARVTAVDGEFPESDNTIDYTVEVLADPNDRFDAATLSIASEDNSPSCGVSWSEGDVVGATLTLDGGSYAVNLCAVATPEVIEIYDDYVRAGSDPTDYCIDQLGVSVIPLSEASLIRSACHLARSATGESFLVILDDRYYSQPLDSLVTMEVGSLIESVAVTPTPTPAPTASPRPTTAPVAATTTDLAVTPTAVPVPQVVVASSSVIPTQPVVVLTAQPATSFGWSPTATSPSHAAAVSQTGAKVTHVSFTG